MLHNEGHALKLDKSLSDAISKGPLRNITCPLTNQFLKMKKQKKLVIMKNRKRKQVFRICSQDERVLIV